MRRTAFKLARRRGRLLLAAVLVLGLSAGAFAFWSAQGSGTAHGSVATLSAPAISSIAGGPGTVELSWSAVTPPGAGSVSYYVSRDGGAPGGTCPASSSPSGQTSCNDTEVSAGTHEYTVTAVWRSWTAASAAKSVEVASAAPTHLVLEASSTAPTAGAGDSLTITAKDAANKTVTGYSGTKSLTFGGAHAIGSFQPTVSDSSGTSTNFGSPTAIAFTNGVASATGANNGVMTLYKAETAAITVTDGTIGNGAGLSVAANPAGAASFSVPTPATQTAGSAFEETLTALDAYGNTATGYAGSRTIAFSGPASSPSSTAPKYPASVSFSAGVGTASITLYKAESTTLTAKEGSIAGSSGSFTVSPATAASLTLSAASTTPTAGEADNLTIAALDAYGNAATGYTGTHTLTFGGASTIGVSKPTVSSSSGTATAFGTATPISFTSGSATASGAGNGVMRLYSAETAKVTVSDGSIGNGTGLAVTVAPAAIASIAVSTPATQSAGTAFSLAITAKDTYGNGASGSQALSFSGPSSSPNNTEPTYPASVSFTNGSGSASVTLTDAQSTAITVKQGAVSGTSGSFTVNPGSIASLSVANPGTQTSGTAFSVGITASDAFGNAITGSQALTFSGPASAPDGAAPSYPANVTFSAGAASASVTLFDAQSTAITVKGGTGSGTSASFTVNPGSARGLTYTGASNKAGSITPTCSGSVTALACKALGKTEGNGRFFKAGVSLIDAHQNLTTNASGAAITVSLAQTGATSIAPSSVSIANGATTSSSSFEMKLNNGSSAATVKASATVASTAVTASCEAS